jgi:RHS repeat-associated protein
MGKTNPIRFSSKYTDDESDFLYYGHRYYNPSTGRWLSSDPIGEKGGINLYVFVENDPKTAYDFLGLAGRCVCAKRPRYILVSTSPREPGAISSSGRATASDLARAINKQLQDVKRDCIRKLSVSAEGDTKGFSLYSDFRNFRVNQSEQFADANDISEVNAYVIFKKLGRLFCFCSYCEIRLLSCQVGQGKVGQLIANATGCVVFAPLGYCSPNFLSPENSPVYEDLKRRNQILRKGEAWATFYPEARDYSGA